MRCQTQRRLARVKALRCIGFPTKPRTAPGFCHGANPQPSALVAPTPRRVPVMDQPVPPPGRWRGPPVARPFIALEGRRGGPDVACATQRRPSSASPGAGPSPGPLPPLAPPPLRSARSARWRCLCPLLWCAFGGGGGLGCALRVPDERLMGSRVAPAGESRARHTHTHRVHRAAGGPGPTPSDRAGERRGRRGDRGAAGLRAVLVGRGGGAMMQALGPPGVPIRTPEAAGPRQHTAPRGDGGALFGQRTKRGVGEGGGGAGPARGFDGTERRPPSAHRSTGALTRAPRFVRCPSKRTSEVAGGGRCGGGRPAVSVPRDTGIGVPSSDVWSSWSYGPRHRSGSGRRPPVREGGARCRGRMPGIPRRTAPSPRVHWAP